jgi:hypothetical protein
VQGLFAEPIPILNNSIKTLCRKLPVFTLFLAGASSFDRLQITAGVRFWRKECFIVTQSKLRFPATAAGSSLMARRFGSAGKALPNRK